MNSSAEQHADAAAVPERDDEHRDAERDMQRAPRSCVSVRYIMPRVFPAATITRDGACLRT